MPDITQKYVKFQRGSQVAYDSLKIKDEDTLYFITSAEDNSGKLYLGTRLISSGLNAAGKLSELADIVINNLNTDDVLIYNGTRWVNTQLTNNETLISSLVDRILTKENVVKCIPVFNGTENGLIPVNPNGIEGKVLTDNGAWMSIPVGTIMTGATETEDGISGLVPMPTKGSADRFLAADGIWKKVVGTLSEETISQVNTFLETSTDLTNRVSALENTLTWKDIKGE